jgi:hypothetical protein
MKKELWVNQWGMLADRGGHTFTLLGYIEVEEPKKTVTKEVACIAWHANGALGRIPPNAKNVRILFDVEE